jgi:hypothetical protein
MRSVAVPSSVVKVNVNLNVKLSAFVFAEGRRAPVRGTRHDER